MIPEFNFISATVILLGLFFGGFVKGAAGAGMPIVAVPVIAAFYDVRIAVILLVIPNFFTNLWQIIQYNKENVHPKFTRDLALSGFIGAGFGTVLLASLPVALLSLLISLIVFLYIGLNILKPNITLPMDTAKRWVTVAGASGGVLQGAIGLSSPITFTFLHATRLPRKSFIITISYFFATMSLIQVPMQVWLGLMNWTLAAFSLLALIPIMIGLHIGAKFGDNFSQTMFDRTILALLLVLGIKMFFDAMMMMFS